MKKEGKEDKDQEIMRIHTKYFAVVLQAVTLSHCTKCPYQCLSSCKLQIGQFAERKKRFIKSSAKSAISL